MEKMVTKETTENANNHLLFFLYFIIKKDVDKLSLERVFKVLVSLGLSETDARVYIFLALKGPKKAGSIVGSLKINKQQIIRSLKKLQNKGLITPIPENQNAFSAMPFKEALELLIKTEKKQTEKMQKTLLKTWKTIIKKNSKN